MVDGVRWTVLFRGVYRGGFRRCENVRYGSVEEIVFIFLIIEWSSCPIIDRTHKDDWGVVI